MESVICWLTIPEDDEICPGVVDKMCPMVIYMNSECKEYRLVPQSDSKDPLLKLSPKQLIEYGDIEVVSM